MSKPNMIMNTDEILNAESNFLTIELLMKKYDIKIAMKFKLQPKAL